jgi:hypothetical protein
MGDQSSPIRLPLTKDELTDILLSLKYLEHFTFYTTEEREKFHGFMTVVEVCLNLSVNEKGDKPNDSVLPLSEDQASLVDRAIFFMMHSGGIEDSWVTEHNLELRDILRRLEICRKLADHEKRIARLEKLLQNA